MNSGIMPNSSRGQTREYALDLGYPMQVKKEISIELPDGWMATLPGQTDHGVRICNRESPIYPRWKSYSLSTRVLHYIDRQFRPEEYFAAKRFFDTLAKEDGSHLILEWQDENLVFS